MLKVESTEYISILETVHTQIILCRAHRLLKKAKLLMEPTYPYTGAWAYNQNIAHKMEVYAALYPSGKEQFPPLVCPLLNVYTGFLSTCVGLFPCVRAYFPT